MDDIKKRVASSKVLAMVGEIEREREAAHKIPTYARVIELRDRTRLSNADLLELLEDLEGKGYIETGRTINDTFVRLKK